MSEFEGKIPALITPKFGRPAIELLEGNTVTIQDPSNANPLYWFDQQNSSNGHGTSSTVSLGYDYVNRRRVAIKRSPHKLSGFKEPQTAHYREALLLSQLNHPNIIPVYDYMETSNHGYTIMPYIEGSTLEDVIIPKKGLCDQNGKFDKEKAISIVRQIGAALDFAHDRGVAHHDVKPANILLGKGKQAYLIDAASSPQAYRLSLDKIVGTPAYMAPELITAALYGERTDQLTQSDIFALGVILFEMVTGNIPDEEGQDAYALLRTRVAGFSEDQLCVTGDDKLDAFFLKALAYEPDERHQTDDELATAFEQVLAK